VQCELLAWAMVRSPYRPWNWSKNLRQFLKVVQSKAGTYLGAILARDGTWFEREALVPAFEALRAVGSAYVVVKAVVAAVSEGGSSIMTCTQNVSTPRPKSFLGALRTRNVVNGSGLNHDDFGTDSKNSSALEVACRPDMKKNQDFLETITPPLT
jgi:hypothetical protein